MEIFFLLGLFVAGGYGILGVIGFFRANSDASAAVTALRRTLVGRAPEATAPVGVVGSEFAETPVVPETIVVTGTAPPEAAVEAVTEPAAPPTVDAPATPAVAAKPKHDLEDLLTARWGVWLGSGALLLAGVFLIRYAVEQELLGPSARCVLAALLGAALLAAAEWLTRHEPPSLPGPFRADQAPAALAAGGTAVLFGAAYGAAHPFYELPPPVLAFLAMAAASFVGLLAALRYGLLTAATFIVGAFATPALVSTQDPSYPGLFKLI